MTTSPPGSEPPVTEHEISVEGPISYPGGKDGSYRAVCSCGEYRSTFGTERGATKDGNTHKRAKERHA